MSVASKAKPGTHSQGPFPIAPKPVGQTAATVVTVWVADYFFPEKTEKLSEIIGDTPELRIFGTPTADSQEQTCR